MILGSDIPAPGLLSTPWQSVPKLYGSRAEPTGAIGRPNFHLTGCPWIPLKKSPPPSSLHCPAFRDFAPSFWEQLAASVQLVEIGLNRRDLSKG
jgi:hypothetical protein